jgi:DNA-binding transcriptional LysR family regulator
MRPMNDHQRFLAGLAAFVGVEGARSLNDAEKRQGMPGKTSIQEHLKLFDAALDCKVTGKGITRTEAGTRIEKDARRLLEELERDIRRATEHLKRLVQSDRPVGIAVSPTIWMWGATRDKLPLTSSIVGHPSAEFLIANSARVEKVVHDGLFEIGITASSDVTIRPSRSFVTEEFGKDKIFVLVPPDHPWSGRQHLKPEDLRDTPLITLDVSANARQIVDDAMFEAGFELATPIEEVATADLALKEAIRGKKPALVPELALGTPLGNAAEAQGFKSKRVKGLSLERSFVLIYPRSLRAEAQLTLEVLRGLRFTA